MFKVNPIEQALTKMKEGLYDFTVDGKCSNCGQCCGNFLPISQKEINSIKRYIKRNGVKEQIRRFPTANAPVDMLCPFRDELGKKCTIYPVRPLICQDFQCDKPRKDIQATKEFLHRQYDVVDMRREFFGTDTGLGEELTEMLLGMTRKKFGR